MPLPLSTTSAATRESTARKFLLLPLCLLPPRLPPPPPEGFGVRNEYDCSFLEVRELGPVPSRVLHDLRLKPPLFLLPRLLLLLFRTSQQRLLEEALDRGSVELVVRRHRRHDERGSPGSHVTERDGLQPRRPGILQNSRPRPRRWSVQCPWAVVHLVLHLLLLLTPRHHSRTSAVVTGCCEGSCDAQLLVSPQRALASLPSRTRCARQLRRVQPSTQKLPAWVCTKNGLLTTQGNACLCRNAWWWWWWFRRCVWRMSPLIHANEMHLIMGTVSLWTRPLALHLCAAGP